MHAQDLTGREVLRALLAACDERSDRIQFFEDHAAIDLILSERIEVRGPSRGVGIYALDARHGTVRTFLAPVTLLASGGSGKAYLYTTNPDVATGDGVAMAYRAGATIANMEFMQFHPTCLFHPQAKNFLISEALRGEGGIVRLRSGEAFLERHHPMGNLAPRDVAARAIDAELKRTGDDYVLLDMTHLSRAFLLERFPHIYATCREFGIDMAVQGIPAWYPLPITNAEGFRPGSGGANRRAGPFGGGRSGLFGSGTAPTDLASQLTLGGGLVFSARSGYQCVLEQARRP